MQMFYENSSSPLLDDVVKEYEGLVCLWHPIWVTLYLIGGPSLWKTQLMCSVCELKNSVRRNNLIRAPLTLTQGGGDTIVLYFSSVQDHIPVMEWELWHRWYWISICESLNAGGRSRTSRRRIRVQSNQTSFSALPAPLLWQQPFILCIRSLRHSFTLFPCDHCWSSAHLGVEHRQVGQLLSSWALDQMRLYFHGPFTKQFFAI